MFTKLNKKLYYFEYRNSIEVDFFIRKDNTATAIEVKATDNTKSKSMQNIISKWNVKKGIKLSSQNLGGNEMVQKLPLYMAMFL